MQGLCPGPPSRASLSLVGLPFCWEYDRMLGFASTDKCLMTVQQKGKHRVSDTNSNRRALSVKRRYGHVSPWLKKRKKVLPRKNLHRPVVEEENYSVVVPLGCPCLLVMALTPSLASSQVFSFSTVTVSSRFQQKIFATGVVGMPQA